MDFACASGQNILLVGPAGSGKTSMINDFFDTQDPLTQVQLCRRTWTISLNFLTSFFVHNFWCVYHLCFQLIFHVYSFSQSEWYHSDIQILVSWSQSRVNCGIRPHGRSQLNSFKLVFQVIKKLVLSGTSKALQLQQFIEANIYHRQGFVYGAKENRKLQMFLDDLNLPVPDKDGVQKVSNKLVRTINIYIKAKTTCRSLLH